MQGAKDKRIRDYIIHQSQLLGEGAFGNVFKGEREIDKQPCAIKIIDKTSSMCVII
jgi:serine/threonine protein kinase